MTGSAGSLDRRQVVRLGALAAGLAGGRALGQEALPVSVEAETTAGRIRGYVDQTIKIFKGVPYGAATGGQNRFRPARPPAAWTGVRDARQLGDRCPQIPGALRPEVTAGLGPEPMSEDCLRLNIWSPALDGGRRPVMVWFHGGGYVGGSGGAAHYDGGALARKRDVVVVTVNHRLNAFGFLHLAEAGEPFGSSGNVGMLDCVAALRWVRDNIERFGGDPALVTIFGQSGGGGKVSTLMAMPDARGLFHRAIAQSGVALRHGTPDEAARTARAVLAQLGLGPHEAGRLQQAPYQAILSAMRDSREPLRFGPVVDGRVLPRHPFDPGAPVISAAVPMMVGSNETETTFFPDTPLDDVDAPTLTRRVADYARIDTADADRLIATYRGASPGETNVRLYQRISSDFWLTADVAAQAERKAALGAAPAYVYRFDKGTPVHDGKLGSIHTLEIAYVFDNLDRTGLTGNGPERYALADRMSGAWAHFARHGRPAVAGAPEWPSYSADRRAVMVFNDVDRLDMDPHRPERLAIEAIKGRQATRS